jgi:hypothetical protein
VDKYGVSASVIVEWYNLTYAAHSRATKMLEAVVRQAESLRSASSSAAVAMMGPLEIIIAFDADKLDERQVAASISSSASGSDAVVLRLLAVPKSNYTKLKNEGADVAAGEIIIFLDSDVVPEAGWLEAMLRAFSDRAVSVVVGNTYVDCTEETTYSQAMALVWMFPLRDASDHLGECDCFYTNNLALRRNEFLSRRFLEAPGLIHHPATLLVEQLNRESVKIWYAGGARGSHPPPNGLVHFVRRAMAGGRARALTGPPPSMRSVVRSILGDVRSVAWTFKRILTEGAAVGMRWWQIPAAMAISASYYSLFSLGGLMTVIFPGLMRDRLQL